MICNYAVPNQGQGFCPDCFSAGFFMKLTHVLAIVLLAYCPLTIRAKEPDAGETTKPRAKITLTPEALKIHAAATLVDGHNDLPWMIRETSESLFRKVDIRKPQPKLHTDIDRLKKGNVGVQFWSAYVPAETGKEKTAVRMTLEQIDVIHRM